MIGVAIAQKAEVLSALRSLEFIGLAQPLRRTAQISSNSLPCFLRVLDGIYFSHSGISLSFSPALSHALVVGNIALVLLAEEAEQLIDDAEDQGPHGGRLQQRVIRAKP